MSAPTTMTKLALAAVSLGAVTLTASTAFADQQLVIGYVGGQPIAGEAAGMDHALSLRYERLLPRFDVGLSFEGGYSPGNPDDTLTRVAIMPTAGVRTQLEGVTLRGDVAVGWQVAEGRTRLGGVPVEGSEARGLRAELGVSLTASVDATTSLRGRLGLALDGFYPSSVPSSTELHPFVELALAFRI